MAEIQKETTDEVVVVPAVELPLELWEKIGKHLVWSKDIVSFRSMCKLSRLALPSPTTLFPLQVPPPPDGGLNEPYFITEVNFYSVVLRSGQRVLATFQQEHQGGGFRPSVMLPSGVDYDRNMLSSSLQHQPPRHSLFVTKGYRLVLPRRLSHSYLSTKMVLISSHPDGIISPSYARASYISVVAHLDTGKLALLRLAGSHGANWEWDTSFCNDKFSDIITYEGRLYTVDFRGRPFVMDSNSLKMTQVARPVLNKFKSRITCKLFEACGELYLAGVIKCNKFGNKVVKICKLSLRPRKWIEIEGLGNQAFVMCEGFNISIPRDAFSVDCGKEVISRGYLRPPALLFSYGSNNGYRLISFTERHYRSLFDSWLRI